MPDAIALLAVTLPIAATILRYAPDIKKKAVGDELSAGGPGNIVLPADLRAIEERLRTVEIETREFRAECRGEFNVIKQQLTGRTGAPHGRE